MIKGKFNYKELERYQKRLEKMAKEGTEWEKFIESCAKELAARLLGLAISRTPVGKSVTYLDESGKSKTQKVGGTLRRGWISKTEEEAISNARNSPTAKEIEEYVNSLTITKSGDIYTIEVVNPVHYASYVENGHRQEVGRYVPAIGKKLVNSWVNGKFMLQISEKELDSKTSQILEKKIKKFMEECFNGN